MREALLSLPIEHPDAGGVPAPHPAARIGPGRTSSLNPGRVLAKRGTFFFPAVYRADKTACAGLAFVPAYYLFAAGHLAVAVTARGAFVLNWPLTGPKGKIVATRHLFGPLSPPRCSCDKSPAV
jgi:hypothetical protein